MGWCGIKYVFNKSRYQAVGEPGWTVSCLGRNRDLSCCQFPGVRPGQQSAGKVEEQKPSVSMWPEWVERGRENFPGAKILWRNAEEGKFCTRSVVMEPDGGLKKFREPAGDRGPGRWGAL